MKVRPVYSSDTSRVVEIMNQAIRSGKNAYLQEMNAEEGAAWFEQLQLQAHHFLVLEDETAVIAWGTLTPYRGNRGGLSTSAEITFYVDENNLQKGVGSRMISVLEDYAIHQGKKHLVAILLDNNLASRSILEKFGFELWANFEGIVDHNGRQLGHMYMGKHIA